MPFDRPAPTLSDVIDRLQKLRLPQGRRRDLISAVRRVAKILGCKPADVPANVQALSRRLANLNAAEIGVSGKTLSNIRANLLAALDASGAAERLAKPSRRSAAWAGVFKVQPLRVRNGLSRLATWCSQQDVEPEAVDEQAFLDFEAAVRTRTLVRSPESALRGMRKIWNALAEANPDLLSRVEVRDAPRRRRIRWEHLPATFRADVEAHLLWARGDDILAVNARPRPLAPKSVQLRRNFIHSAVTSLVEAGWSPEAIVDLRTLTSPSAFCAALGRRVKGIGKHENAYNASLGRGLLAIAKERGLHTPEEIAELKRMLAKIPAPQPGLTTKNKALLRAFDDPGKLDDLVRLPTKLWVTAMKQADPIRKLADAQAALAIGILLYAPLRRANLVSLAINEHVFLPKQPNAETLVELPAELMKTREPFTLVLPPSLTRMLRAYDGLLGNVISGPSKPLFINPDGSRKGDAAVARLTEKSLRRHLGVKMTCHQFRHLAGKIMLDADPGAYETLRQLLGHKDLKTTLAYYAELDTRRVSRIHAALIERRLARNAGKRRPTRH